MDTGQGVIAVHQARTGQEEAEVIECNTPIHLLEDALDDVFDVNGREDPGLPKREQVPPRIRCEPSVLVGTEDAKREVLLHVSDRGCGA